MAALPFNKNWKYQMIGTIMSADIVYAMLTTPIAKSVSLAFSPYLQYSWWDLSMYGFGKWPWPSSDWGICFVNGEQIKQADPNNLIYAIGGGRRCSVAKWKSKDSHETIGNRIWHEMLHAQGLNPDMLGPNQPNSDFNKFRSYVYATPKWRNNTQILNWLNSPYSSPYENNVIQRAYYTMLWTNAGYPIYSY